jgi:hypothetical protein
LTDNRRLAGPGAAAARREEIDPRDCKRQRNRRYLRNEPGSRNSNNSGEKPKGFVVGARQKNNGMKFEHSNFMPLF